jgi:hypothetical protein
MLGKRRVWTATVDSIIAKLARCRQTLEQIQPGCTAPKTRNSFVQFCYLSNPSLASHVYCFNAFECSPRTLKAVIALGQPSALFNKPVILLNV